MPVFQFLPIKNLKNPHADEKNVDQYSVQSLHMIAFLSALAFTLFAVGVSCKLIAEHMLNFNKPPLQRHVFRVLMMAPIYAICSVVGIGYPEYSLYLDVVRDSYEAFTIYSFLKFLLAVMGGDKGAILLMAGKPQIEMLFPLNYILKQPWSMGVQMVYYCKYGALQYVLVKPLCAILVFVAEINDFYGDQQWRPDVAYPYISVVSNLSQIVAMYCLVQLFFAAREELEPWNPVPKFLSVKAVVFFTFWQGVALSIAEQIGLLKSYDPDFTSKMLQVTLQNWLVCFEMCVVSLYHKVAFPVSEYQPSQGPPGPDEILRSEAPTSGAQAWKNILHSTAPHDVVKDARAMAAKEGIAAKEKPKSFAIANAVAEAKRRQSPREEGEGASEPSAGGERLRGAVSKLHERLRPT